MLVLWLLVEEQTSQSGYYLDSWYVFSVRRVYARHVNRHTDTVCCRKYYFSLCVILIQIKSLNVPFRCRTWYLQQQKHIGGTFRSSEVTQEIGVPLFHSYTKQMGYSLYICDLSVKLNECSDHPLICRA